MKMHGKYVRIKETLRGYTYMHRKHVQIKETPCGYTYMHKKHVQIKERRLQEMESLEEIYQKHARTVYAYLLGRTRNQDLAEELTQETFFQAVRTIDTFRGDSKLSTWLCGIARNLWLAHLRESRKSQPLEEMEEMAVAASPEEELSLQWDNLEILKLLHGLKEPIREVMYLRLIGNLTFAQIGEIMGKSENWTRVNYYRGKERIRREAGEHGA